MNHENMNEEQYYPSPELQRLLADLLDGQLSDADRTQLNALLKDNPAAQDAYRRVMAVHALLHLDLGQSQLHLLPPVVRSLPSMLRACPLPTSEPLGPFTMEPDAEVAPADLQPRPAEAYRPTGRFGATNRRRAATAAVLAASVLVAAFLVYRANFSTSTMDDSRIARAERERTMDPQAGNEFTTSDGRAVAILSQATRAAWSDSKLPTSTGARLTAGKFQLDRGIVQIEFMSGATAVVEGPAKFELLSSNDVICSLGKIRAHVPSQARGFTIVTPDYKAVDLGTEFTVEVDNRGESEIHVVDGEVEVWDERRPTSVLAERLTTGRGVRSTPGGELASITEAESKFVGREQLMEIAEAAQQERYENWRRFSEHVRTDPNVVLYFGFEDHKPWQRVLHNDSVNSGASLDGAFDGAIVGCQWTEGRWHNKQALEFKRTSDRVRISVPGEFDSLTFSAWVRLEGFERWLSSLMLTDGHQLGEVHWQLTDLGQMLLGVKAEPEQSHDFYSPTVFRPEDLGRWVHLACVYNGNEGYVRHYVDGAEISRENVQLPTKLRIGAAEIGNWVPQDLQDYRIRSLNGRMDEFILFDKPLTADEVAEIYEAGKPQS